MKKLKTGRNDPCSCGSGKKFKKCCAQKQEQTPIGLRPAVRMKGGVSFDQEVNAFRVVVHSWDNTDCLGAPKEWQSEQTFQSEESGMTFYKVNIRPKLERLMQKIGKKEGVTTSTRRLEE